MGDWMLVICREAPNALSDLTRIRCGLLAAGHFLGGFCVTDMGKEEANESKFHKQKKVKKPLGGSPGISQSRKKEIFC